jgi:hypothetical protein
MATKLRRLILSLPPELDRVIDQLALAQEKPRATAVTDLLLEMTPHIEQIAKAIEQAKQAPDMAFAMLMEHLADASLQAANAQKDLFTEMKNKVSAKHSRSNDD